MHGGQATAAIAAAQAYSRVAPHLGSSTTNGREGERLGHEALHQVVWRLPTAAVQLLIQSCVEHLPLQVQRCELALLRRMLLQEASRTYCEALHAAAVTGRWQRQITTQHAEHVE